MDIIMIHWEGSRETMQKEGAENILSMQLENLRQTIFEHDTKNTNKILN